MFTTGGPWVRMLSAVAAAGMAALLVLLVVSAAGDDDADGPELSGVDLTKVPKLAQQMLPVINDVLDRQCPELPAVWVVAEVQAESGWNPKAHSADSNGGASGLYQMNDRNWAVAGGRPGEITVAETHLRVGIPWVCTNLRAVTGHLAATHKPTEPLDAMLVCHIAGCGRVTGSATGVPKVGEAGCGSLCVSLINRYIANVHRYVAQFSTPPAAPPRVPAPPRPDDVLAAGPDTVQQAAVTAQPAVAGRPAAGQPAAGQPDARAVSAQQAAVAQAAIGAGGRTMTLGGITSSLPLSPAPFTGAKTGCTRPDPTSRGCLTATTVYGLESAVDAFGDFHAGPTLRSAGCWDAHAWNPTSDHAKGRACDLFPGAPGKFAQGDALIEGWRVANWYRANATALHIKYLIWQGRYWQAGSRTGTGDVGGGWGQRYDGGGVYNTRSATGGHYDHVHVSYQD